MVFCLSDLQALCQKVYDFCWYPHAITIASTRSTCILVLSVREYRHTAIFTLFGYEDLNGL